MNYIKKLQLEVENKQERINELEEIIFQLKRYVNLPKFHCEGELQGYVHIKDVLLRLND